MTDPQATQLAPSDQRVIAYRHVDDAGWALEPASARREWMDATTGKFAYRCLPLVMANQSGWVVRIPGTVSAKWGGKVGVESLSLRFVDSPPGFERMALSHFGHGILSFGLPWVFRTPPGIALLVRGPTNHWVTNAHPLDGVVETDWISTTFTMNWQMTARNKEAWFRKGDPICILTPIEIELMERLQPEIQDLQSNPTLLREVNEFQQKRRSTLDANFKQFMAGGEEKTKFELDYVRGQTPTGAKADSHRTNIKLKPWRP